ncbi:HAD-IIIA family hydrolase [Gammaproteobacteria bacterium]|nr:HAD-IIIA family hydrolase [Gammaproteobacteria bacterium]
MNKINIKQAAILCGGLGSRLGDLTLHSPKPMMQVEEFPFLYHLLEQLSDQGIKRFLLMTGYLGEKIHEYFGDGSKWGWEIVYSSGPKEWDTCRRIFEAKELIDDRFILLYSDNFINLNLFALDQVSRNGNSPLTVSLVKKESGNISFQNGQVLNYDSSRKSENLDYVEVGYMVLDKSPMLDCIESLDSIDTSFSEVIKRFVDQGQVAGHLLQSQYHSISDKNRLELTRGFLAQKNIILLDRDGVINQKVEKGEYVADWSKFKFIETTLVALEKLSDFGFEFIIISNQAGVARNMITEENLNEITLKMTKKLRDLGINILETYVCKHHWDEDCFCRKPEPGNFFLASEKYQFRLDKSIYVGDDSRDCQAAFNAGCKSIFLGASSELHELTYQEMPLSSGENFLEILPAIMNFYNKA